MAHDGMVVGPQAGHWERAVREKPYLAQGQGLGSRSTGAEVMQ